MPPLALAQLFHSALPGLSVDGRAVINTLLAHNGRLGSVEALCQYLGLRSRFQLNRLLRREGLPPYEELAGWVCVFYWMLKADTADVEGRDGRALRALAIHAHMDAASCYRLVRRVTGRCWTKLRDAGTQAAVVLFLQRTRAPQAPRPSTVRPPTRQLAATAACGSTDQSPAPAIPRPDEPRRLPLAGAPYGIGVRGRDLVYVTRYRAAVIERLDLATGELAGSIPIGCMPTCVAFHPAGHAAYASVQYGDEIAVIDTTHHRQVGALQVSGDPFPLVVSSSGRTLFVTTNEDRLFGLSPANGRVIGSLRLPATSHHLALHPAGGRIYVATRAGGSVLEVDTTRYQVLRTFALGGWPQGMAVSPDGTLLYCANEQHGLDVVRLATGKRLTTLELEDRPVSLALSPDHRLLYAGLVHVGKIAVISAASLEVLAVHATGGRPREFGFDRRAGKVLVANEAGWIDILPLSGRDGYRFDQRHQPPTGPVALSAS
jgi:DNA-binding beta-propeller fold protein YncE